MNDNESSENWERDALAKLAGGALDEQRRSRRWSNFFKGLTFLYLLVLMVAFVPHDWDTGSIGSEKHVALIDVKGVIADDMEASADNLATSLRDAYDSENTAAVILRINSPGGSPVQSSYINTEIRRQKELHPEIPVYAVITDMCASGGYYVAVAADQIFADKSSVVGSIGVRMGGFGFVDAIEKMGIERRLLTAGKHKGLMDPFQPIDESAEQHLQSLLNGIHQEFIKVVKAGRGDKLADDPKLFSGLVWTGEQSLELGLIDGFGSPGYVAREILNLEEIVDYTARTSYLEQFAKGMGASVMNMLSTSMQLR